MNDKLKRRLIVSLLCVILLCSTALAASAIPSSVLKAADAVVRVTCQDDEYEYTGSGFVIESTMAETFVITNYHVIEGDIYNLKVWVGNASYTANIVNQDTNRDLALLRIVPGYTLPALKIAKFEPKRGSDVYAIGFPAAADTFYDSNAVGSNETTVTSGTVSTIRQMTTPTGNGRTQVSMIQTDATINGGNSGGPLVNHQGQVVGINTYSAINAQGIYGAISTTELQTFYSVGTHPSYGYPAWMIISAIALVLVLLVCVVLLLSRKSRKKNSDNKHLRVKSGKTETLAQYIQANGPQSAAGAIGLLMPLLTEVRDAHNNGSSFPTLSPADVIVRDGKATLSTSVNLSVFANGFTASEIYRGRNSGAASDIYALGALLYFTWTAQTPKNALERSDWNEINFIPDNIRCISPGFSELIEKCMSVEADERFQDVQSLIVSLLPYRMESSPAPQTIIESSTYTQPIPSEPVVDEVRGDTVDAEQSYDKPTPKKTKKKHPVRTLILSILALLVLYCGACAFLLSAALKQADTGNFTEAQQLIDKGGPLTANIASLYKDGIINNYIIGGLNLENGSYSSAIERFEKYPEFRNSEHFIAEAASAKAWVIVEDSGYQTALQYLSSIIDDGDNELLLCTYEDILDSYIVSRYQWDDTVTWIIGQIESTVNINLRDILENGLLSLADAYILNEDYIGAFIALKEYFTENEIELLYPDLKTCAYENCRERYYAASYSLTYENIGKWFKEFGTYKDAESYVTLCEAQANPNTYDIDKLIPLLYFADTKEVIYSNHNLMCEFLKGTWESNWGNYFSLWDTGDGYQAETNLPKYPSGDYFYFIDGVYTVDETDYLRFSISNKNTVTVYNYRNGDTVEMFRQ